MVTIGATAGGYVKGIEATSFAKWNKGITDRFKESYIPGDSFVTSSNEDAIQNYTTHYLSEGRYVLGYWAPLTASLGSFSLSFTELDPSIIDSNKSIVTEFYKYVMADASQKDPSNGSASSVGFIPFKLGLTMDGLSGIKIYNSIQVDTTFFPSNYPDVLNFIVTGVNHKLQNNDWETEIETMVIPKNVTPIPALDLKGFKSIVTSGGGATTAGSSIPIVNPDADFWSLITIAALEDGDPQGRADVAQAIYNRVGANAAKKASYGGTSISAIVKKDGQFAVAFIDPSAKSIKDPGAATSPEFKAINDKNTAIAAIISSKRKRGVTTTPAAAEKMLKDTYNALKDITLQNKAKAWVEGRTDFLATKPGGKERNPGDNSFGWYSLYKDNVTYEPPNPAFFNAWLLFF